jgi:hypothetical protein
MRSATDQTGAPRAVFHTPLVVARRWDQLGGRLSAIVNARSLAQLLGIEFRFVWPEGLDPAIRDPREIFSEGFLDAYQLDATELEHRTVVPHWRIIGGPDREPPAPMRCAGTDAFIEVNEIFEIVHGPDEDSTAARQRYRHCFQTIDWSQPARELVTWCQAWNTGRGLAAVHVRAGDIVVGEWRHVVAHEKYLPTPFLHYGLERLSEDGDTQVLVVSDNAEYLAWLKSRFSAIVTSDEVVPGYGRLTELQQAFADILLLSRCSPIVGPPSSAFSRLAANLSSGSLVRADMMVPAGRERAVLLGGIAERQQQGGMSKLWGGLLAHDVCWCLDVFGDTLPLGERRQLARRAVACQPEFVAAHARLARIAAVAGDWRSARDASARAVQLAESVDVHEDALMEALATDIATRCFAAFAGRLGPDGEIDVHSFSRLSGLLRMDRRRRSDTISCLGQAHAAFRRCRKLVPYWCRPDHVTERLAFLLALAARVVTQEPSVRRRVARTLGRTGEQDIELPQSGLAHHRTAAMFDPLVLELDRLARRADRAVRGAGLAIEDQRFAC